MDYIISLDHQLLVFINQKMQNSFFDILMPLIRNKYIWIPFYVWIITFVVTSFSSYKSSYYLLFIVSAIAITDVSSGQILKKFIQRERPCQDLAVANKLDYRAYCSQSYGFPSSHAANHFGLAMILIVLFAKNSFMTKYLLLGWATLISFAQVYVGVHHPLDVIGGCILGILLIKLYTAMIQPILEKLETNDQMLAA